MGVPVDVAVVGGGLAGALLIHELRAVGPQWSLRWLDRGGPRASDTRVALIHPYAGRSFRPRANVRRAWRHAVRWCDSLPPQAGVAKQEIHRHLAGTAGPRLRASLRADEFRDGAPVPVRVEGEWAFYPGIAVDLLEAVAWLKRASGIDIEPVAVEPPVARAGRWQVAGGLARCVVLAGGVGTRRLLGRHEAARPLNAVPGAMMVARGRLPHCVIAGGHAASTTSHLAWGSTFDLQQPQATLEQMRVRLRTLGVDLPGEGVATLWSGERVVDERTRLPWARELESGLFVLSAFGSQGGLFAPWCAAEVAQLVGRRLGG